MKYLILFYILCFNCFGSEYLIDIDNKTISKTSESISPVMIGFRDKIVEIEFETKQHCHSHVLAYDCYVLHKKRKVIIICQNAPEITLFCKKS